MPVQANNHSMMTSAGVIQILSSILVHRIHLSITYSPSIYKSMRLPLRSGLCLYVTAYASVFCKNELSVCLPALHGKTRRHSYEHSSSANKTPANPLGVVGPLPRRKHTNFETPFSADLFDTGRRRYEAS